MSVPEHEHITVDEDLYFALLDIHGELERGKAVQPGGYLVRRATDLLEQARRWNADDPRHHLSDAMTITFAPTRASMRHRTRDTPPTGD